ncbi:hypothetical protein CR513_31617, partial [Mucuna pruriens]
MKIDKAMKIPMETFCYLDKDESENLVEIRKYRGMIGFLLYLTTSSLILCLLFACVLIIKLILKNHSTLRALVGYSNFDFARYKMDRKSTSMTCHLFGSFLISWNSKKHASVALSTTKAKYIGARGCCA